MFFKKTVIWVLLIFGMAVIILKGMLLGGAENIKHSLTKPFLSAPPEITDNSGKIPILMYHKVNPDPKTGGLGLRVPPEKFEAQMKYLADCGYRTISLSEVTDYINKGGKFPLRSVVLTFDDGYLDNYQYVFPILKKYGYTATIFVVANCVGKENYFDARTGIQPENKLAGWDELKEMAQYGIIIGSHTLDHPRLAKISSEEALRQIRESKALIEKNLKKPVFFFAYPYGSYKTDTVKLVKESGYLAAVTSEQGLAGRSSDVYTLKRIRVLGSYDLNKFIKELHK